MPRVRRCDSRCHNAKGNRCECWCGGFFHGAAGAKNRAEVAKGNIELLKEHGFQKGKTIYLDQMELNLNIEEE